MAKRLQLLKPIDVEHDFGAENAGKIVYIGEDGFLTPLTVGDNLSIENGVINAVQHSGGNATLTADQISALDGILKIASFTADPTDAYAAFQTAFGITDSGDDNTEEETHTHSHTSSVTTAATCETAGVRTYICSCGDSYTEVIEATGHNYVDGTCVNCGAADPDYEEEETEQTEAVYTLAGATAFDGTTEAIDTGYALYGGGNTAWSICLEVTDGYTGTAANPLYFAGPSVVYHLRLEKTWNAGPFWVRYDTSQTTDVGLTTGGANQKFVITHAADTRTITVSVVSSDAVKTTTITAGVGDAPPTCENTVMLGYNGFVGTIHGCAIYERVLTTDEINEYLGVSV